MVPTTQIPYTAPIGATIRCGTRRHWFELVDEIADAAWWSLAIVLLSIGLSVTIYNRLIWLILLCAYPLAHVSLELARWAREWLIIVDYSNGKSMLIKQQGILKKRKFQDYASSVGRERIEDWTWLEEKIGYKKADIRSMSRIYIEGHRVPLWFLDELDNDPMKEPDDSQNKDFAQTQLQNWVKAGLISETLAQQAARRHTLRSME